MMIAIAANGCGQPSGPIHCGRATGNPNPGDALATAHYGMVATWHGFAQTPVGWVPAEHYAVAMSFATDGTYQAHTTDNSGSNPFYYDRNPEADHYDLTSALKNGDVSGDIYLQWLPAPDVLQAVRFSAALTHLHFEYLHAGAGPVVYELDCTP
jgi:hypothetical protein